MLCGDQGHWPCCLWWPWSLTVLSGGQSWSHDYGWPCFVKWHHGQWPWSVTTVIWPCLSSADNMVSDHGLFCPWCHLTKHGRIWSSMVLWPCLFMFVHGLTWTKAMFFAGVGKSINTLSVVTFSIHLMQSELRKLVWHGLSHNNWANVISFLMSTSIG